MRHDTRLESTRLHHLQSQQLATVPNLSTSLEIEIAHRCRGKVTKRLALKLALAVISDNRDGMFLAEKLVDELRPRVKHEAALREIYLEREVRERGN